MSACAPLSPRFSRSRPARAGLFNPSIKEAEELLPRHRCDNIVESTKFATGFPDFVVTTYREGITQLLTSKRDGGATR